MGKLAKLLIVGVFANFLTSVNAGEFSQISVPDQLQAIDITFEGVIEIGDSNKLRSIISAATERGTIVRGLRLNSQGGILAEALEIGRAVRKNAIATIAPTAGTTNRYCASACALVWLAGIYRIGAVDAHRAYLTSPEDKSFDNWETSLSLAYGSIKSYLEEMGISDQILDSFLATPSYKLTRLEAGNDVPIYEPAFEEFLVHRCGPPLSQKERAVLKKLEIKKFLDDQSPYELASENDLMLLDLLQSKRVVHATCGRNSLRAAQSETQLKK